MDLETLDIIIRIFSYAATAAMASFLAIDFLSQSEYTAAGMWAAVALHFFATMVVVSTFSVSGVSIRPIMTPTMFLLSIAIALYISRRGE